METTSHVTTRFGAAPARLSARQKRDLAGICISAVVTTAMSAAPFLIEMPQPLIQARAMSGAAALPVVSAAQLNPIKGVPAVVAPRLRSRLPVRSVDVPAFAPVVQVVADAERTASPRKPLARRLAGLFTGDGSNAVRPFPTVSATAERE